MKITQGIFILLLGLTSLNTHAVSVIVHPSNADAIDVEDVKKIFLGKSKKFPGGGQALPLELGTGDVKESFLKNVVGKSESQYKAYWSKLIFTGKGQAPTVVDSESELLDLVSKNPNLIGYVSDGVVNDSVKLVGSF